MTCVPAGRVAGGLGAVEDDHWGEETAVIRLDSGRFGPEALLGLEDLPHLEVVYHFDRVPPEEVRTGARHPRGTTDWPLAGILAQRGKNRPNRLGVSRCRLLRVDGPRCTWPAWTPWTALRCSTSSRARRSSGRPAGPCSPSGPWS
ncbi:TrmO family methyltransferase domain-containing protein [Streptomyces sp. enrichment culture]|uniref:TrmO family methyltransferase domain-containing protein n=1 Tax=Streptomyces sp. enrichment culture TaxID=1795815 RepID=UPI003F57DF69